MTEAHRIGSPPQAPPPRPAGRRRWPLFTGIGAAAVVVVVGAFWASVAMARHDARAEASPTSSAAAAGTIRGAIELDQGEFEWSSKTWTCWGRGGYDDLAIGAQVTVTDANGKTIGLGQLSHAAPQTESTGDGARGVKCTLSFEIDNVPRGAGFYGVEVAHRGVVRRAEGDVFDRAFQLTIG